MTPLQKIAMGLLIVVIPADFHFSGPPWRVYDLLPDPVGWSLALFGVWALPRALGDSLALVKWLGVLALLVSVPLWFPQVPHLIAPAYHPGLSRAYLWALGLPQSLFGLALSHQLSRAGREAQPRDAYVAGRFGVLMWGFALTIVLPAVVYGGGVRSLETPTLLLIGLVNFALVLYLFLAHRREIFGGPGPRQWVLQESPVSAREE